MDTLRTPSDSLKEAIESAFRDKVPRLLLSFPVVADRAALHCLVRAGVYG